MVSLWSGRHIRLRGVEATDWRHYAAFNENSADARNVHLVQPPRPDSFWQEEASRISQQATDDDCFALAIEELESHSIAGLLSTYDCDRRAGTFKYGIALATQQQRKGFGLEATTLLLNYMFGERRYHKCLVTIHEFNTGSIIMHKKAGFTHEGILREQEFFAGRRHDTVVMGILSAEYFQRYPPDDLGAPRTEP